MYIDSNLDESYTPTKIGVEAGYGSSNIIEFAEMILTDPAGWQDVDFSNVGAATPFRNRFGQIEEENVLHTFKIHFLIKENFQNGKDTHLRGVRVYVRHTDRDKAYDGDVSVPVAVQKSKVGPVSTKNTEASSAREVDVGDLGEFSTLDFRMQEDIR